MAIEIGFRSRNAFAITLVPLLVLASCATAVVGDEGDAAPLGGDAGATLGDDAGYGGNAVDPQSPPSDAATPIDAGIDSSSKAEASIPRTSLVGEWLFSGNLNDTSGNGFDGTATGATLGVDRFGHASSAAVFNGVDQYVSVADEPVFALNGDLTVSAWINPTNFPSLAGIVSKCQSSSCATFTLRLGYFSPYSYIDVDSAAVSTVIPSQLVATHWQHVAAVMSGATASIYVNGVLVYSHAQGYTPNARGNTLRFGVDYPTRFFSGSIDDIRIYTRALASSEIAALAADK